MTMTERVNVTALMRCALSGHDFRTGPQLGECEGRPVHPATCERCGHPATIMVNGDQAWTAGDGEWQLMPGDRVVGEGVGTHGEGAE